MKSFAKNGFILALLLTTGLFSQQPTLLPFSQDMGGGLSDDLRIEKSTSSYHHRHGRRGPRGHRGHRGKQGKQGPTGAQGPAGAQGIAGDQGPTGPQGPAGISSYAFGVETNGDSDHTPLIPIVSLKQFSSDISSSGSTANFTFSEAGLYSISYDMKIHQETDESSEYVTITVNNPAIPEGTTVAYPVLCSIEGTDYVTFHATNQFFLNVTAGTTLTFYIGTPNGATANYRPLPSGSKNVIGITILKVQ